MYGLKVSHLCGIKWICGRYKHVDSTKSKKISYYYILCRNEKEAKLTVVSKILVKF